jgi:hypothetical protein
MELAYLLYAFRSVSRIIYLVSRRSQGFAQNLPDCMFVVDD